MTVTVEVRELRTDADASPIRNFDVFAFGLQKLTGVEFRRRCRTAVREQAITTSKTTDNQIQVSIAVVVGQLRTAVTDQALAINGLTIGFKRNWCSKLIA